MSIAVWAMPAIASIRGEENSLKLPVYFSIFYCFLVVLSLLLIGMQVCVFMPIFDGGKGCLSVHCLWGLGVPTL